MIPRREGRPSLVQTVTSLLALNGLCAFVAAEASQDVLAIEKASNASLFWGPYRPNLYFGVRPRVPNSLLTGLLWSRVEDYQSVQESMFKACISSTVEEG